MRVQRDAGAAIRWGGQPFDLNIVDGGMTNWAEVIRIIVF